MPIHEFHFIPHLVFFLKDIHSLVIREYVFLHYDYRRRRAWDGAGRSEVGTPRIKGGDRRAWTVQAVGCEMCSIYFAAEGIWKDTRE
jgi:hypothetical protein